MEEMIEKYKRITLIGISKIPVSEDSPIYNLFQYRRELCKRFGEPQSENNFKFEEAFNRVEEKIKEYLNLKI